MLMEAVRGTRTKQEVMWSKVQALQRSRTRCELACIIYMLKPLISVGVYVLVQIGVATAGR
jgi:hypothetical protein